MEILEHSGVLGMRWGVRKKSSHDSSLSDVTKYRRQTKNAYRTKNDVDSIVNTMSKYDRQLLGITGETKKNDPGYMSFEEGSNVAKRVLKKIGSTPVSFFDLIEYKHDNIIDLNAAVGTRNDDQYRHRGYARQCVRRGLKWFEKNKDRYGQIYWWAWHTNDGSIKLATGAGFRLDVKKSEDSGWQKYTYGGDLNGR